MKKHYPRTSFSLFFTALLVLGHTAELYAQTDTWDATQNTTGGSDGSNVWNGAITPDWYNGSTAVGWVNDGTVSASIGVSSAGTVGSPDTITISSANTINVASITFNNVTPYLSAATGENTGYTIAATNSTSILNLEGTGQIVDNTAATTVSIIGAAITGSAGLTKSGTGTLALTGIDTYTGGTTVSTGTLQIGNGGSTGGIIGNITDNSVLAFDNTGLTPMTTTTSSGGVITHTPNTISGSGSVLLMTGTLMLPGADSYQGGTTVNGGTLQIGNASSLGSASNPLVVNGGTIDLNGFSTTVSTLNGTGGTILTNGAPGTLTITSGGTFAGALQNGSGTLSLTQSGGTLTLTGANTYGGTTTISAGTFQIGNGGTSGSLNTAGNVADSGSLVFDNISPGATSTLGGIISGNGSLTQEGAGSTVILTGANSYSGGTTISAGTLQVGNGSTTGSIALGNNVTDNGSLVFDTFGTSKTFSGVISGNGTLTQEGTASTLIFTGAESYSGGTTISSGTIQIGNGGTSGSINASAAIVNNGSLVFDSTNSTAISQSSVISGTGKLTQEGTGNTLILSGANTFTGGTTVTAGTVQVGNLTALGATTGPLTVNGGTVDLQGNGITIGILTGTGGTILNNGAATTLSIGASAGSGTYGGVLANGTGTLALNQVGGLEILTNTNTYTRGTTLSGGTLQIGNTLALGPVTNNLVINGGALDLHGFNITVNTLNGGTGSASSLSGASTLTVTNGGLFAGSITDGMGGTVALTQTSGTLILEGANQYSGTTTISAGTLQVGSGGTTGSLNASGTLTNAVVNQGALIFDNTSSTAVSQITGILSGSGTLTQEGAGSTLVLSGTNTYSGGTALKAGTIQTGNSSALDGSSGALTMSGGTVNLAGTNLSLGTLNATAGTILTNNAALGNANATLTIGSGGIYSGVLSDGGNGSLALDVNGGTMILNGTNTYTGGTTVASGTLQVGSGGSAGSIVGTGTLTDAGSLIFDKSGAVAVSGGITGSGGLTQQGTGTLTLSGANTYLGTTHLNGGGTLDLAAKTGSISATSKLTFGGAGGTFNYDNTGSSGAKTQNVGALTLGSGEDVIQSTLGGASGATLTFSSLAARGAGATGNFVTSGGANGTTNSIKLTGQAAGFINAGTFFEGGTANANYAYYDSGGFVRGINYGTDAGSIFSTGGATIASNDTGNAASTINSSSNVEVTTAAITAQTSIQLSTLQISGALNFTQTSTSPSVLTVAGILKSGGNAATISGGSLTSNSSTDLVLRTDESGDSLTISDPITSSTTGGITKSGAGTLILSGNNAYTGATTVNDGILKVSNANALGSTSNGLAVNGGTLDLNGNAVAVNTLNGGGANGVILDNGSSTTLTVASGGTFAGSLQNGSGTLSLTQTAGTLVLTGADTYSGTTTVNGGTLQIGSAGTPGSLNTSGGISLANGTSVIFDNSSPGASSAIGGGITGGGNLTQEGAGSTVILSGTNSYSGTTSILAGTLQIGNGGTGGSLSSATVTDNGGLVFDTTNTTPVSFSSSISGSGTVTQEGAGSTLILGGTDTYTGGTTVTAGTLQLANGNAQNQVTINGGAFDLHGHSTTFAVLNGTGGSLLTNSANATLTVTGGGTYGGALTDGASGVLSLVQTGGTLTLSGTNTYSGGTSVDSGLLSVAGPGSLPGTVSIANNASVNLAGGGTYANTISLIGVGSDAAGTENVTGALSFSATGTATMTGAITLGGPSVFTENGAGVNAWNFTGGITGAGGLTLNAAGTSGVVTFGLGGTNTFTGGLIVAQIGQGANAPAQNATVQLLSAGAIPGGNRLSLNSTTGLVTSLDLNGFGVSLSNLGGSVGGTSQVINSSATLATLSIGNAGTDSWSGLIGGTPYGSVTAANNLALVISGTTNLVLTSQNTYTGGTTIGTGSTLQLGNGGVAGSFGTGAVTDNGTLLFDVAAPVTVANAISGSGPLTQESGFGHTLTLSGVDTYLGATSLNGGNLTLAASTGSLNGTTGTNLNFGSFGGSAGGTFTYDNTGSTGAKTQGMGALAFGAGEGAVQSTLGGASSATLTFSSLAARGAGVTGDFITSGGTNGTTNSIQLTGQATGFIDRGIFFDGGTANASYAYYDSGGFVRGINYGVDAGSILSTGGATIASSDTGNAASTINSSSNVETTGAVTAQTSTQISTLQISGANNFTLTTGSTLTVAGLLKSGGNAATISGGSLTSGNSSDLVIRADQAGDVLTLADAITSTTIGGITKSGTGTLILTAANTYSGGTTIDAGTLQVGSGGTVGSINGTGPVAVYYGAALVFDNSSNTIFNGGVTGGGNLTQEGTGTLVLTGGSSYTGVTTISAGTLQVGNGTTGSLSPNSMVVDDSALILDTTSFGGLISGTGTVTQHGANSILVTGADTYTGATIIDGGGSLNLLAAIASLNGSTGTALTFNGGGGTFNYNTTGAITAKSQGMGALTFHSGEGEVLSTYGNAGDVSTLTFSSLAARQAGATGDFVTSGGSNGSTNTIAITGQATGFINAGLFYDGGAANASYAYYDAGGFVRGINYGSDTGSIWSTGGSTIASNDTGNASSTINSSSNVETTGAITGQGSVQIGSLQISGSNNFTQSGGTLTVGGILKSGGNAATISGGNLTTGGSSDLVLRADQSGDSLTVSDTITSSTTGGVTKSGAGTVILTQSNAYTGTTTVDAGTLRMGNSSALGSTSNGVAVNGGTLDLNGNSLTAGGLNGAGGTILGDGTVTLTLNGGGTYAGVIANGTGTLSLSQTSGTLILTGANTYTGGTTLTGASTLQLGNGGATGSLPAADNVSLGSGSALVFDNVNSTPTTMSGTISGAGSVTQEGAGNTLILTGSNGYSGGTTITAGTLQVGNGGAAGSISTTNNVTNNGALVYDTTSTTPIAFSGTISGTGSLTEEGAGSTLVLTQNDTYSGGTMIASGATLQVGNGGTTGALSTIGNIANNGVLTFDNTNTGANSVIGGAITGTGSLTQEGTGNTLVLTGANTYSGGTTITAGTLQVGNGGVTGSLPSGSGGNVVNNSALVFDTTAPSELITGVISGTGGLTQEGAGNTLILAGTNSYSGGTTITAGTLQVGNGGNNGSLNASSNVADNGALVFNSSATPSPYTGVISGTGSLTQQGTGTLYLSGINTYQGGTSITGGTLQVSSVDINLGSGNITLGGGELVTSSVMNTSKLVTLGTGTNTLAASPGTTATYKSAISGSGGLTVGDTTNTGTVVLSGSGNNYGGGTTIATGSTLQLGSGGSNGDAGTGNIVDNGSVVIDRSGTVTETNAISGTGSVSQTGTGTVTLSGTNTYSGGTSVSSGVLQVASIDTNLGTGNLTLGNGELVTSSGTSTSKLITLNTGTNTLATAATTTATYNGVIGGTGSLTLGDVVNTGTVALTAANTYLGSTFINAGVLNLTGSVSGPATIASGATLTGTGSIAGMLNEAGGGTIVLASADSTQSLKVGGLTLGVAGSYTSADYGILDFTGGSSGIEQLNDASHNLTANNVFVDVTNAVANGVYTLATFNPTNITNFSLSSTVADVASLVVGSQSYTLNDGSTAGSLTLTVATVTAPTPGVAYWDGAVSTIWNDTSSPSLVNWSTNLAGTTDAGKPPGAATDVILNSSLQTGTVTTTLGADTTINSLNVNGNGVNTIAAGNTLTLSALADTNTSSGAGETTPNYNGNAANQGILINSAANAFTINAPVQLGGNQTWTNNSANGFTVGGGVSGSALSGTQTLTLSNTGIGGTVISGAITDGTGGGLVALVIDNPGTGLTQLTNAGNSYSGGTTITSGAVSAGSASAFGPGNLTLNGGTLSNAAGNPAINVGGSFTQTAGTLALTVASPAQGVSYTVLNVTGAAALGGTLEISATGYTPGETFSFVLSANAITGSFASIVSNQPAISIVSQTLSGDHKSLTVAVQVSSGVTFNQWEASFGFTGGPTVIGPAATPENDGVPNLFKYLYDINPTRPMTAADRAALAAFSLVTNGGTTYLTLTYRQYALETGITINVQTSPDLQTWTTVSNPTTTQIGTDPNTGDPILQVQVPATAPREFIRLNLTQ
jgi:fibronectin-binding autotransporter adhesin